MPAAWPRPQTHTTTLGHVYSYYYLPPHDATKPTILFLHGYPDMGLGWKQQTEFFVNHGYGAVVPDLLGAGRTDKPQDVESYRIKFMAAEVMEIVDNCVGKEGRIIAMGHDWGAYLSSRIAVYHSSRLLGLVQVSVPHMLPSPWDLAALNAMTKQVFGLELYGYWDVVLSEEGTKLITEKFDAWFSVIFSAEKDSFIKHICPAGKLWQYLRSEKAGQVAPWVTEDYKKDYMAVMRDEAAVRAGNNWYRVQNNNLNWADEKDVPKARFHLKMPVLQVIGTNDPLSPKALTEPMKELCDDLKIVELEAEHWVHREKPQEYNQAVKEWLESKFGNVSLHKLL